jgi:hypothetical protein
MKVLSAKVEKFIRDCGKEGCKARRVNGPGSGRMMIELILPEAREKSRGTFFYMQWLKVKENSDESK